MPVPCVRTRARARVCVCLCVCMRWCIVSVCHAWISILHSRATVERNQTAYIFGRKNQDNLRKFTGNSENSRNYRNFFIFSRNFWKCLKFPEIFRISSPQNVCSLIPFYGRIREDLYRPSLFGENKDGWIECVNAVAGSYKPDWRINFYSFGAPGWTAGE